MLARPFNGAEPLSNRTEVITDQQQSPSRSGSQNPGLAELQSIIEDPRTPGEIKARLSSWADDFLGMARATHIVSHEMLWGMVHNPDLARSEAVAAARRKLAEHVAEVAHIWKAVNRTTRDEQYTAHLWILLPGKVDESH